MAQHVTFVFKYSAGNFNWVDPSTWDTIATAFTGAIIAYNEGVIVSLIDTPAPRIYIDVIDSELGDTIIQTMFTSTGALTIDIESATDILWGGCRDSTVVATIASFSTVGAGDITAESVVVEQWGDDAVLP